MCQSPQSSFPRGRPQCLRYRQYPPFLSENEQDVVTRIAEIAACTDAWRPIGLPFRRHITTPLGAQSREKSPVGGDTMNLFKSAVAGLALIAVATPSSADVITDWNKTAI